jgi:hypothetical protein
MAIVSNSCPWLGQQIEMRAIGRGVSWLRWGSLWLLGGLVVWQHIPKTAPGENNLWQLTMSLPLIGYVKSQKAELPGKMKGQK